MHILVTYSTQSGTSQKLAELCLQTLVHTFDDISIKRINEVGDYVGYDFVIFFISTYGDGEPCDDGVDMYDKLESICDCKYSIFGCGNSMYDAYQECAKRVDKILFDNNCERIGNFGMSDESHNKCVDEFWDWMFDYTISLSNAFDVEFKYEKFQPLFQVNNKPFRKISNSLRYHEHNPYLSEIDLKSVVYMESKRYVMFDLAIDNTMNYKTGDHVAIIPKNRAENVERIVKYVEHIEGCVSISTITYGMNNPWENCFADSLFSFLMNHVEICCRVTRECIRELEQFLSKEDQEKLETLDVSNQYLTLSDVFERLELKLVEHLPLSFILQHLGPIKPRLYSIASAHKVSGNKVKVFIRNDELGVCTSFINDIIANTQPNQVLIYISKSRFKPPSVASTKPILLIAAGSGLAPYLGFFEEFSTRKIKIVPSTTLLLGGKTRFCEQILAKYEKAPLNLIVKWALSLPKNENNENELYTSQLSHQGYVQDILATEQNRAGHVTEESHIYICGSCNMAAAVRRQLELILGEGDPRSGDRILKKMASLGRFQQDVW